MIRFLKSSAFKIFAIVAAALLAGSVFALASRSGSSPLTSVTSFVFGPVSRAASFVASEFSNLPISFRSSSALAKEIDSLEKELDGITIFDSFRAPHYNPEDPYTLFRWDLIHYSPQTNDWVSREILEEYKNR